MQFALGSLYGNINNVSTKIKHMASRNLTFHCKSTFMYYLFLWRSLFDCFTEITKIINLNVLKKNTSRISL